jgi:hypothetical protein
MSERKGKGGTDLEEQCLRQLYDAAPGSGRHRELEQQFNAHRRTRLGQAEAEYVPLQDVRHEFQFSTIRGRDSEGNPVVIHRVDGTLRDPATVINWRNTDVGKQIDQKARSQFHGTGDDAGHLAALWAGADPKEMQNLGAQNFVQNQGGGTYHGMEMWYRKQLASNPEGLKIQIDEKYMPDKYGDRPMGRIVRVEGDETRYFVNPTTAGVRDRQLGVAVLDPKVERRDARSAIRPQTSPAAEERSAPPPSQDTNLAKRRLGPPPSQGAPAAEERSAPPPSQDTNLAKRRLGPPPSQGAPAPTGEPPAPPAGLPPKDPRPPAK